MFSAKNQRQVGAVRKERRFVVVLAVCSDIFVVLPVFAQADQLAFMAVEVFNDQLRLIELRPFQTDQKILAGTAHVNVFRSVTGLVLGQNEFATLDGVDTNWCAFRGTAQFDRLPDCAAVDNDQFH
ncbi:hypothetical protein KNO81_39350 [Paraburkholderia sediminicola]|nr:hypothetical protein [Paraburkholderia sediminicola]